MDYEDRQRLCDRITSGQTLTVVDDVIYIIKDPLPSQRQIADYYYQLEYDKLSLDPDILTVEEAKAILIERGLWSHEHVQRQEEMIKEIDRLTDEIPSLTYKSKQKQRNLDLIKRFKKEIKEMNRAKDEILIRTKEYMSASERYKRLLFLCTFDYEGNRVWVDWEEFDREDEKIINKCLNDAYFNTELNETAIRELARSEPWRSIWLCSVKAGNLFNFACVNMSDYQRALVSWSIIYDNAMESMEAPSLEVIHNDEEFDSWLRRQGKDKKNKSNGDGSITENQNINNATEVGIVVDSPEDAKKVYELNDANAMKKVKQRQRKIDSQGKVREQEMPDIKQQLQMDLNRHGINQIKKG